MRQKCAIVAAMSISLLTGGCAGLSEIQNSVSQLDQSVHTLATAESNFLVSVRGADCEYQFLKTTYMYAQGKATFQVAGYCIPSASFTPVISDAEIKTRNDMLTALTLYADQLQALASSSSDKNLDTNSKTLATNLNSAVTNKSIKLPAAVTTGAPGIVDLVTTAFTKIAEMVIDAKTYSTITDAAGKMQTNIDSIALALEKEDYALGQNLVAQHQVMEIFIRSVVASNRTDKFDAAVQARNLLASTAGQSTLALATMPAAWTDSSAQQIVDAAEAARKANQAVALGAPASISAEAHDLYQRATAANDFYNSLSTTTASTK
jgi:hypothetical protein